MERDAQSRALDASGASVLRCGGEQYRGNQITNFLPDLPYKDEPTWWEPQHVHNHRVRGETVEIVEVSNGETQVTLHFKA